MGGGNGKPIADFSGTQRHIHALAYSPNGGLLAAAGQQRTIRLSNTATGKPTTDLPERPGKVLTLAFCGEGVLAAGGSNNLIRLWDVGSGQGRCRLIGHTGSVSTLAWDAQRGLLISGGFDCTIRVWQYKGTGNNGVAQR